MSEIKYVYPKDLITGKTGLQNGDIIKLLDDKPDLTFLENKNKLQKILSNPSGKLIAVDMDGTICDGEFWGETDPKPQTEIIEKMWSWYKKGGHIIIYTARQPKYYAATHAWLIKHGVPFHGICMLMKPGADCYIDDKALNVDDI